MNKKTELTISCDLETGTCAAGEQSIEEINLGDTLPKIEIYYYTDPICSACWALEPTLKRFTEEYGHLFRLTHRMGGLLPGWEGFQDAGNGISKPSDVAEHWEEVGVHSGMPIDGDVWYEDPITSSFPPSIAFKAAQLQGEELADKFLRRIREMVFLEKTNIAREEHLTRAAVEVGLDKERFLSDYHNPQTKKLFEEELQVGRELGVRGFPTLLFINADGKGLRVPGFQAYETYVNSLERILGSQLVSKPITMSPADIVQKFGFVATKEVADLLQINSEAAELALNQLAEQGTVEKVPVKQGFFWRSK